MFNAFMRGWIVMMIGFAGNVFADSSPAANSLYVIKGDLVHDKKPI